MKDDSALERLEQKLSSRGEPERGRRSSFFSRRSDVPEGWKRPDLAPRPRRIGWLEVAFIASAVFFVVAVVFAAYLFFSGANTVSTRNVGIAIDGPVELRAGDPLALTIAITNKNAVPMELADLVVEFPPGTRSATDISIELPRIRESLGSIAPGQSITRTVRAVVFGSANTSARVGVTVEYRVPSSNAIFFGDAEYVVPVTQSPVGIAVDGLTELISGQEAVVGVQVTSNVDEVLKTMLLEATYPPGFSFVSSVPAPYVGEHIWRLGDIESGGTREVNIRGRFSGEDGDERVILFEVGSEVAQAPGEIAAPLATGDFGVFLAKPFVAASLALGGSITSEYTASRGEVVRGDIRYTNNLTTEVQDVEVVATLAGPILDRASVRAERGFYNSNTNTITWSRETLPELSALTPGASGVLTFSFGALEQGIFRNPTIDVDVTVRARRLSEENVPERIESTSSGSVLIGTDLALARSVGVSSGSPAPRAGAETAYLVSWIASNSVNAVAGASASAVLPSYVTWGGSPDASVSFNPVGGIVTWTIGDLAEGTTKQTHFTVTFTPSLSQVGSIPVLVSDQRIYGFDRFTREDIERIAPALTVGSAVAP